jgi:hypothetical protein
MPTIRVSKETYYNVKRDLRISGVVVNGHDD